MADRAIHAGRRPHQRGRVPARKCWMPSCRRQEDPIACPVTMCTATSGCRTLSPDNGATSVCCRQATSGCCLSRGGRRAPLGRCGAGDSGRGEVSIGRSREGGEEGKGEAKASPLLCGSIWYDDQIALFRIDLGGMMKRLLLMCGWLLMAGATALGLRRNSGDRWGNRHRKGPITAASRFPKASISVTFPDPVYCGRISTGTGWRILKEFDVAEDGGLKDTVVWLADAQRQTIQI